MNKIFKKSNIFSFILGALIFGSIGVAASELFASSIKYKDTTVENAIDDLYNKANSSKVATQVATLTTQGASYTMQNDGYIIGTIQAQKDIAAGLIFFNSSELIDENKRFEAPHYTDYQYNVSIYAPKGTVVYTRQSYGTYNLTVYEWK